MKFEYKIRNIKNFELELPVVSLCYKGGSRIVLVSDYSSKYDEKTDRGDKDFYLDGGVGQILKNAIDFAIENTLDHTASKMAVFNFQPYAYKDFKLLAEGQQQKVKAQCAERFQAFIEKYKPDIIVFCGDAFLDYFDNKYTIGSLPIVNKAKISRNELFIMHGRLMPVKIGSHKCEAMHTLGLRDVCSLDPTKHYLTDLLGFLIWDLSKAFYGKNRYTLPQLQPKGDWYTVIDSMYKWKGFYEKLKNADIHCNDTEAANLNRVFNQQLLTVQSGFDGKHAFVIPYDHLESSFSDKEKKIIAKDFKHYFEYGRSKYQVGHNLQFDFHVYKGVFGVEYFNHDLCDTQATEYFLDENRVALQGAGYHHPYSLGNLALEYGGFSYLDSTLGKKDRKNMAKHSLADIAEYGAIDCLHKDTKIVTNDGLCKVSDLKVGDKVLSYNHDKNIVESKKIQVIVKKPTTKRMIKLSFNGNFILVTEDHKVWSEDRKSYIEVKHLNKGEKIIVRKNASQS